MYSECTSYPSSSARSARGNKLRSSICCFRTNAVEPEAAAVGPRTPRSPCAWLKSTAHELEIRERCRRVKARIKGSCRNNNNCGGYVSHQRQNHGSPADFSYDPLSYALNFEDDVRADEDESYRSFTARLPASPPVRRTGTTPVVVRVC